MLENNKPAEAKSLVQEPKFDVLIDGLSEQKMMLSEGLHALEMRVNRFDHEPEEKEEEENNLLPEPITVLERLSYILQELDDCNRRMRKINVRLNDLVG